MSRPKKGGLIADLRLALDADLFARACGLEGDGLDPWQRQVLDAAQSKILMNCSRQSGKSTVASLAGLRAAVFQPKSLVLLVSPSMRQSSELFKRTIEFYGNLERAMPASPKTRYQTQLKLELYNGSRIISLPGSERTVRGFSAAAVVILDEASRVPDELIASLTPMQAVTEAGKRRFIALSTPAGRRGWFYQQWMNAAADPSWLRVEVRANACPRISREFLLEQLKELGPHAFAAEYECQFQADEQALFTTEIIERAFSARVKPIRLGRVTAHDQAA